MLTDKAKKDFEEWFMNQENYDQLGSDVSSMDQYYKMSYNMQMPLIIDWFDDVRIHISVFLTNIYESSYDYNIDYISNVKGSINFETELYSRGEATQAAIITANDIYNAK